MDRSLGARLARHPIIATLYGAEQIDSFVDSASEIAIVANVELRRLQAVVAAVTRADKVAIVNIDSCEGISPDKAGVEYLAEIGATAKGGVNRQTLTDPNLVQLMPAPMLSHITLKERSALPPIVASGFVSTANDVRSALAAGAVAVSTSDSAMWNFEPKPSGAPAPC